MLSNKEGKKGSAVVKRDSWYESTLAIPSGLYLLLKFIKFWFYALLLFRFSLMFRLMGCEAVLVGENLLAFKASSSSILTAATKLLGDTGVDRCPTTDSWLAGRFHPPWVWGLHPMKFLHLGTLLLYQDLYSCVVIWVPILSILWGYILIRSYNVYLSMWLFMHHTLYWNHRLIFIIMSFAYIYEYESFHILRKHQSLSLRCFLQMAQVVRFNS